MKDRFGRNKSLVCAAALFAVLMAPAAFAYVGPGAGLGLLGAIFAIIAAAVASLVGLVLWPIRRLLRKIKGNPVQGEPTR